MKGPDDVKELRWTSNLGKYFKKALPVNQIKGLCEIYEGHRVAVVVPYISLATV